MRNADGNFRRCTTIARATIAGAAAVISLAVVTTPAAAAAPADANTGVAAALAAPTAMPWRAGLTVRSGSRGPTAVLLQQRLTQLGYDPGEHDGSFGTQTRQSVWAFQHVHGLPANGHIDAATSRALFAPRAPAKLAPRSAANRIEVNIAKQYAVVYLAGRVRLITHISSGSAKKWCEKDLTGQLRCASGRTPAGTFRVQREIRGVRTSYLGELHDPVYFRGGYALHGSLSVPNEPASHGCVRVPMHVAKYLMDLAEVGMPVIVR